jgi:hypothetical protein
MTASCFNCCHWKSTFPDIERAKATVLWDFNEPDWTEKSCEIFDIERRWPDRGTIGALVTKHQSGGVDEVREEIAAQCPEYERDEIQQTRI